MRSEGVYYAREDYASSLRRLAILAIDGAVLVVALVFEIASVLAWVVWTDPEADVPDRLALLVLPWLALAAFYIMVIERTTFGTLGTRLTRCRVVDLHGRQPGLFAMALRFAWIAFGPLNPLLDVAYSSGDADRQTLRDKFAGTYVVRRGATPAGRGAIVHGQLHVLGWTLLVSEVRRDAPADGAARHG